PNWFVRPDLPNNQPGGMLDRPGTAVPYPTMGRPGSIGQPPIRPSSAAGYGANHGPHPAPGFRPISMVTNIPPAGTFGNNQRPLSGGRNAPFMVAPGGQPPYGDNGYGQQPYPEEPFAQPGGFGGPRPGTAQPGGRPGPGGPPAPVRPGTAVGPGPRPGSGHADV